MVMTGIFSSFGICYIPLMPVIARDVLNLGARGYGFLMSALGAGALTGGLTLATLSRTRHRGKILITGTGLLGILLLVLSLVRHAHIALILFVFIGFCQTSVAALTNTLIQTLSPDYVRGRAMSVFNIFFNGMFPVGSLIAGTLAQTKGAPFALFISGVVVLITLFTATAIRPQLHRL